eukprot:6025682-Lingulodinium_polyedra.AAC.1
MLFLSRAVTHVVLFGRHCCDAWSGNCVGASLRSLILLIGAAARWRSSAAGLDSAPRSQSTL